MMRAFVFVFVLVLLTGCSSGIGQLEKGAPQPVTELSLIRPPWQTLVKAGPGASKDVDFETLDGPQAIAPSVSPQPAATTPTPAKPVDPNATVIKAVAIVGIAGASAQGNQELAAAMAKVLRGAGWPTITIPRKDALIISAVVILDAGSGPNQTVHLTWKVTSPKGRVLGTVAQNNAVPAHSLDASWGTNAEAAAEAAAEGIFRLIGQYR